MNLIERIFSKAVRNPNARTHVVNPTGGRGISKLLTMGSALRRRPTLNKPEEQEPKRGMWVALHGTRVGVLTNLELGDVATVMIVDDKGLNVLEVHIAASELRQAWYEEIPEARRPDYETAARMGYHGRPQ